MIIVIESKEKISGAPRLPKNLYKYFKFERMRNLGQVASFDLKLSGECPAGKNKDPLLGFEESSFG